MWDDDVVFVKWSPDDPLAAAAAYGSYWTGDEVWIWNAILKISGKHQHQKDCLKLTINF